MLSRTVCDLANQVTQEAESWMVKSIDPSVGVGKLIEVKFDVGTMQKKITSQLMLPHSITHLQKIIVLYKMLAYLSSYSILSNNLGRSTLDYQSSVEMVRWKNKLFCPKSFPYRVSKLPQVLTLVKSLQLTLISLVIFVY